MYAYKFSVCLLFWIRNSSHFATHHLVVVVVVVVLLLLFLLEATSSKKPGAPLFQNGSR